ncbi:hypothetical protein [Streptomyces montanus]|uniref:hypothetical protein n=1 Tax=Streptomyces montanus TaxID=2580423 RepID=UPI001486E314|nr:hypothetical protein [Streptomyces montanus]
MDHWSGPNWYPQLCERCEDRAIEAERRAEEAERERQEQEAAQAAQKASGWLSRFRT